MLTFVLATVAVAQAAAAPPLPIDLAAARASQLGSWTGKLEYRDYQADRWFGLPVAVTVSDGGDGVTQLRVADFDDGPRVGTVRITSMTMLGKDGATEFTGTFRKGRDAELDKVRLTLARATDATHWTIVSEEQSTDDDRPARIRVTTVRDGDTLTALKEVDFTDDAKSEWLQRNRETLTRAAPPK